MANMISYISNLSKSVGYSAIDTLKESNSKMSSFIETNDDFIKIVYNNIKDYKKTSAKIKKNISQNEYYKAGNEYRNNLFEDLKSGNFYNRERIKKVDDNMMSSIFGSEGEDPFAGMDDFNNFSEDTSIDNLDWDLEDVGNAMDQVGEKTSNAISNATVRSADYIAESAKAGHHSIIDNIRHMNGQLTLEIDMVNSNIANLINFNNEAVKVHIDNSTKFYETITELDQERNKLLIDILGTLKTNNGSDTQYKESQSNKKKEYEDIVDSEGMIDIESYTKNILNNINNMTSSVTDMLTVFGDGKSNMIHALVASPLKVVTDGVVKLLIPKIVNSSMEEFNNSLGGFFGSLMLKLNTMKEEDGFIKNVLGKIFGVESKLKTSIDTSKFNRGPIPWDGEAKKSLTEIIPSQIAKLISILSGQEIKLYDFEKGKFTTESEIRNNAKNRFTDASNSANFDTRYEIKDIMKLISFNNEETKKSLEDDIDKILTTSFKKGKLFNHRELNDENFIDWNIDKPDNINIIKAIFENVNRSSLLNMNSNIMSNRQSYSNDMKEIERKGGIESLLYNNFFNEENKSQKNNKNFDLSKAENIVLQKDNLGNNIYFYMQNIVKELSIIRNVVNRHNMYNESISDNNTISTNITPTNYNIKRRNSKKNKKSKRNKIKTNNIDDAAAPTDSLNISYDIENSIKYKNAKNNIQKSNENILNHSELADGEVSDITKIIARAIKDNRDANKEQTILDELMEANNLGKKIKVFNDRLGDILKKPATYMAGILHRADQRLFDLIYGRENDPDDRSLLTKLFENMKTSFSKFNEWLDQNILNPIKEKFTKENMHNAATKFFGMFGIDFDDTVDKTKKYLFGDKDQNTGKRSGGLFGNLIQGTKDNLKGFGKYTVNSFKDVYSPVTNMVKSYTKHDINDEYKSSTIQDIIKNKNINKELIRKEKRESNIYIPDEAHSGDLNKPAPDVIHLANGTKFVPKTTLATLTEGEAVIPREFNPFYNNKEISKEKQIKDEKKLADNFFKNYGYKPKGFASGTLAINNTDIQPIENDDLNDIKQSSAVWNLLSEAGTKTLHGIQNISEQLGLMSASEDDKERFKNQVKTTGEEIQKSAGSMGAGAIIGAGTSLLTGIGGPLIGAIAGSAIGLLKDSKLIRETLFGVVDDNGQRTKSGIINNNKLIDTISKYLPDMTKYGLTGGLTAMLPFVPGGPLAGIVLGSTIGFAKNNEEVKTYLFGEMIDGKRNGGLIGDTSKIKDKIQDALPNMTAGAIGGLLLGPFGIAGNLIFGSALGYATSTEKFKTALFGEENENGKREGGIIGSLKTNVVDPLSHFIRDGISETKKWFGENIFKPLADAVQPIKKQIRLTIQSMFGNLTKNLNEMFSNTIGAPLNRFLEDKLFKPMTKFIKWSINGAMKPAKFITAAPFKVIGAVGDHFKRKQIASGNADYLTASERNEFRDNQKRGLFRRKGHLSKDKFREFDENLENMNIDDMTEISNKISLLKGTKSDLEIKRKESLKNISNNLYNNKNIDFDTTKSIMNKIKKGDYKKASKILRRTDLSDENRDDIFKMINKEGTNLETLKELDKDKNKVKSNLYDKLKEYGFNDINDKNLGKYSKLFKKEINARNKSPQEELIEQSNVHHTEIVDLFKDTIEQLRMMNDSEYKEKVLEKKKKKIEKETHKRKGIFGVDYGYRDLVGENEEEDIIIDNHNKESITGFSSAKDMLKGIRDKYNNRKTIHKQIESNSIIMSSGTITGNESDNSDTKNKNNLFQYVSDMKGRLIKLKTNSQGESVPDTNDSQTDDTKEAQAREEETQNNINNNLTNLGSTIGSMFKKFLFGEEYEEKKSGMDYIKATLGKVAIGLSGAFGLLTATGLLPILNKFWTETTKPAFLEWFKEGPSQDIANWLVKHEDGIMNFGIKLDAFGQTVVDVVNDIPSAVNSLWSDTVKPFLFGDGEGSVSDIFENKVIPFYLNGLNFIAENIIPIGARLLTESIPYVVKGLVNAVKSVLTFDFSNIFNGMNGTKNKDDNIVVVNPNEKNTLSNAISDSFLQRYNSNLKSQNGSGTVSTVIGNTLGLDPSEYSTAQRLKADPDNILLKEQLKRESEEANKRKEKKKYNTGYTDDEIKNNSLLSLLSDTVKDDMNYIKKNGVPKNEIESYQYSNDDKTYINNTNNAANYNNEQSIFSQSGTSFSAIDNMLGTQSIAEIGDLYYNASDKDKQIITRYIQMRTAKEQMNLEKKDKDSRNQYDKLIKQVNTIDLNTSDNNFKDISKESAESTSTIHNAFKSEIGSNNPLSDTMFAGAVSDSNNTQLIDISTNSSSAINYSTNYTKGATRKTQNMLDNLKKNAATTNIKITNNKQALEQSFETLEYGEVPLQEIIDNDLTLTLVISDKDTGEQRYATGQDILRYSAVAKEFDYNIDEGVGPVDDSNHKKRTIFGAANKVFVKSALGYTSNAGKPMSKIFGTMAKKGIPVLNNIPVIGKLIKPASRIIGGTFSLAEKGGQAVGKAIYNGLGRSSTKKAATKAGESAVSNATRNVVSKLALPGPSVADVIDSTGDVITSTTVKNADNIAEAAVKKSGKSSIFTKLSKKASNTLLKEGTEAAPKGFIKGFLSKIKTLLTGFIEKPPISTFIEKAAGGKAVVNTLKDKIINIIIKGLTKVLGPDKAVKLAAKLTATASTAGIFNVVMAAAGAWSGWDNANNILGVIEQPSVPIRLVCALVSALNEAFLYGIVPLDVLVSILLPIVKLFGVDTSKLEAERQEAANTVEEYNKLNNTNLTVNDYNNKDKFFYKVGQEGKKALKTTGNFLFGQKASEEEMNNIRQQERDATTSAEMIRQILSDPGLELTNEDKAAVVQEYNKEHKTKYSLEQYDEIVKLVQDSDAEVEAKVETYKKKHTKKNIIARMGDSISNFDVKKVGNWFGDRGNDIKNIYDKAKETVKKKADAALVWLTGQYETGYYETNGSGCYYRLNEDKTTFDYYSAAHDKISGGLTAEDISNLMKTGQIEEGNITVKDPAPVKMAKDIYNNGKKLFIDGINAVNKAKDKIYEIGNKSLKYAEEGMKSINNFIFGYDEKAYYNDDGSYYIINKDKKSYTHYNTHGDILEKEADGKSVSSMIQSGVLIEGVKHKPSGITKLINGAQKTLIKAHKNAINFTKNMLLKAKDAGNKALKTIGKATNSASEFLIGKIDKAYYYSDGSYYVSNGNGNFTYYNSNGDIIAENIPLDKIEAEIKSGLLTSGLIRYKSGLSKKLKELNTILKDTWNEGLSKVGGAITNVKDTVVTVFSDLGEAIKKDGLLGGVKKFLKPSTLVYFDTSGCFYQLQKDGTYTFFNPNWDIIAENIPASEVQPKINSGLLTAGKKKKDSDAKKAIDSINKSISDAWDTAKNVVTSGWKKFTNWLGISGNEEVENAARGTQLSVEQGKKISSIPTAQDGMKMAINSSKLNIQRNNSAKGSGFVSQLNKSNIKYGNSNLEESGCGPAVAATVLNKYKNNDNINIEETAKYAQNKKYVMSDGSTNISYFKDILERKAGIDTKYYDDKISMYNHVQGGNPVILMGSDRSNKSKNDSPFGSSPHYVLANSISKDGKYVYIDDPESKKPNKKYLVSKIFGHSTAGIGIGASGSNKIINQYAYGSERFLDQDLCKFAPISESELNSWLNSKSSANSPFRNSAKVFLEASRLTGYDPRYIVAHAAVESGWGTSRISREKNNFFGIAAYDASPYASAYSFGTAFSAGIIDGAKWIKKNYYDGKYKQTTLRTMRFCKENPRHQYATDPNWHTKIASVMATAPNNGSVIDGNLSISNNDESTNINQGNSGTFVDQLISAYDGFQKAYFGGAETSNGNYNATSINGNVGNNNSGADIVNKARSYIGKVKYTWGARDPDNGKADCSGFTQSIYKMVTGKDIGSTTRTQIDDNDLVDVAVNKTNGQLDYSKSGIQTGDIVLWTGTQGRSGMDPSHVGIYSGDDKVIHCSSSNPNGVKEVNLSSYPLRGVKVRRLAKGTDLSASGSNIGNKLSNYINDNESYNINNLTDLSASGSGLKTNFNKKKRVNIESAYSYTASGFDKTNINTNLSSSSKTNNKNKGVIIQALLDFVAAIQSINNNTSRLMKIDKIVELLSILCNNSSKGSNLKVKESNDIKNSIDNTTAMTNLKLAGIETTLKALINNNQSSEIDIRLDDLINELESIASE